MACLKLLGLMLMEGFSLNADNRWTHGGLTSLALHERLPDLPSYLVRNPTLAPQLEKTHETLPSSREEGHL